MNAKARAIPDRLSFLARQGYAHRGLHRPDGPAENSLPAFAAALETGHGMECDVRLSADGVPHVFHDARLDRMTQDSGPIAARTASELAQLPLKQDSGTIPTLAALLCLIAGRAPLLIEVKIGHRREIRPLCEAVAREIRHIDGQPVDGQLARAAIAVMSFHPGVARWFHRFAPAIPHGLVVTEENRKGLSGDLLRHLAMRYGHPDFLAYDIRDLPSPFARRQRAKGIPVLSWTVRTAQHWRTVEAEADAAIFEEEEDR